MILYLQDVRCFLLPYNNNNSRYSLTLVTGYYLTVMFLAGHNLCLIYWRIPVFGLSHFPTFSTVFVILQERTNMNTSYSYTVRYLPNEMVALSLTYWDRAKQTILNNAHFNVCFVIARDHYVVDENFPPVWDSVCEEMASGRDEPMEGEYMRTQREMEDISFQCARVVSKVFFILVLSLIHRVLIAMTTAGTIDNFFTYSHVPNPM